MFNIQAALIIVIVTSTVFSRCTIEDFETEYYSANFDGRYKKDNIRYCKKLSLCSFLILEQYQRDKNCRDAAQSDQELEQCDDINLVTDSALCLDFFVNRDLPSRTVAFQCPP